MALPPTTPSGDGDRRVNLDASLPERGGTPGGHGGATHAPLPSMLPTTMPTVPPNLASFLGSEAPAQAQPSALPDDAVFTLMPASDLAAATATVQPVARRVGVLGTPPNAMAPGQDLAWIAGIAEIPPDLAQHLVDVLRGRAGADAPDVLDVRTRRGNRYLRIEVRLGTRQAQVNFERTPAGLRVTQAQHRQEGAAWQGKRAPHASERAPGTERSSTGASGLSSLATSAGTLRSASMRDDDTSTGTRSTRRRTGDGPTDLPPLTALVPVALQVRQVPGSTLHHELDDDASCEGRHALHHFMQGGYLPPNALPPLAEDPAQAWYQLTNMVKAVCGRVHGLMLNVDADPGGLQRAHIMGLAELSGVLLAQTAPERYTVFVRESRRGHENETGWLPWAALQTTSRDAPRFASADEAVAHFEAQGCGAHAGGLRVLVPANPPQPLRYGRAAFLANDGLVPFEHLHPAEVQGLEQVHGPLHLHTGAPVHDPQALGARLVPNALGVYLQAQGTGEGGCPACVVNHLVQGCAVPTDSLPTGTLDDTKNALRDVTGVDSIYFGVIGNDAAARGALKRAIRLSGSAMFEVGDLAGRSVAHHVALKRMSGRNDGTGQRKWVVFDSGRPGQGVPASATPFEGPQGLWSALEHIAQMTGGVLSAWVPQKTLPPLDGGGGVDLGEGHVRTQHLLHEELQQIRQTHPGVTLRVTRMPAVPAMQGEGAQTPETPLDLETRALEAICRRLPNANRLHHEACLTYLADLDHLPLSGLDALPDILLERAVQVLGLTPTDDTPPARREALQRLTVAGALQGLSLTQFLCLPQPLQEHIVDETTPRQKRAETRRAWNEAFGLGLSPPHLTTGLATLQANARLLELASRTEDIEDNALDHHAFGYLRRWVRHAELRRAAGSGNPVAMALQSGSQLNEDSSVTAFRNSISLDQAVRSALRRVGGWYAQQTWRADATPGPLLRMDADLLREYDRTVSPQPRVQALLVTLMNAVEPHAMDGHYSPTNHALHRHADVNGFLSEMASHLPAGVPLSGEEMQALTALHGWFRNRYYLEVRVEGHTAVA